MKPMMVTSSYLTKRRRKWTRRIVFLGVVVIISTCWAREADTRSHFLYHDNKAIMDYQQHMYTPHYVMEEQTSIHAEFAELVLEEDTTTITRNNQSRAIITSPDDGTNNNNMDNLLMTPYFLRAGYPIPRVVEWYSPWCGHCQTFVPKYIGIAEQVLQRLPPHSVEFHAISCHEHRHLCQQYHIKGYPTIRAYPAKSKDGIDMKVFTVRSISDVLDLGITNSHAVKSVNERLDVVAAAAASNTPASSPTLAPQNKWRHQEQKRYDDGSSASSSSSASSPLFDTDDGGGDNAVVVSPQVDILGASHDGHRHTRSDVYNDAARSFTYALEHHIFQNGQQALTDHQAETLSEWLDLLYWTLPPTWMIHTLIHDLRRNIKDIVRSKDLFMTVLRLQRRVVHHDDLQWSEACLEHNDGYACGLWSLFHIMSIGVMERHRSVLGARDRITTRHAAEALKNYMDHFFPFCPDCRDNFLTTYHQRNYRRRFRQRTRNKRTPPSEQSWQEFPLWLWEYHNEIKMEVWQNSTQHHGQIHQHNPGNRKSKKKLLMSSNANAAAAAAHARHVQWPSRGECHRCYKTNGNWDKQQVLQFLKEEYWPSGVHNFRYVILDRKDATYADTSDQLWEQGLKIGLPLAISLVALFTWRRRRQRETFLAKGLHKKYY